MMHPKLQDFLNRLGEMLAFVAPERRPSVVPVNDYCPYGQEDMRVEALIIGNQKLAAFVHIHERGNGVDEDVRVEEIKPWVCPSHPDRDHSIVSNNGGNYCNAYWVIRSLLDEFAEPFKKKDFGR